MQKKARPDDQLQGCLPWCLLLEPVNCFLALSYGYAYSYLKMFSKEPQPHRKCPGEHGGKATRTERLPFRKLVKVLK